MTRLIDADALIENLEYDVELDTRALDDADLLLGMDRELVQFDKDCKQNVVDILKNAPTVDAIPIEFIKSEIARMKEGLNPHHPECAIYADDLGILIKEWEGSKKEYEAD